MKQRISLPNLGILTAFASSLCCIMPVIAIIAGTSGLASTFSWLEPARPYFIGSTFKIEGMTCTGCEHHVTSEINKLKGITEVTVSYEKGNAIVFFDDKQTTINDIIKAINSTGYKAINHKIIS